MRKTVCSLCLLFFALLVQTSAAQTRPVTRIANVESIFVDRDSFRITYTSCGREIGGMFIPCMNANKKRDAFFDALERWLEKYGVKVTKDADLADVVLRGKIHMDDDVERRRRDYKSGSRGEPLPADWRDEDWTITAWLDNPLGDQIWKNGQHHYPKPSHGWSSIGKIKGKELAKEIEYAIKKGR